MKKGFIAAPLLGTIIFLTSIIFVVNLNKAEASEVSLIANEAYHNRVTSLLELYRADMGSQFRESLGRTIEDFLSSQCWNNLFKVTNKKYDEEDRYISTEVMKYRSCLRLNDIIHDVICSSGQGASSDEDERQYSKYGLPKWMSKIAENFTFEGIKFRSANYDQFSVFLGEQGNSEYGAACRTLLSSSLMDCRAFSEGTRQCCSKTDVERGQQTLEESIFDENQIESFECGEGENNGEILDCSEGTFYIKVNVEAKSIYPNLPRTLSSDGKGNEIRTGAISDGNFYLPINYPLFKYYDYAYDVYEELQTKINPKKSNLCLEIIDSNDPKKNGDCGTLEWEDHQYSFGSLGSTEQDNKDKIIRELNELFKKADNGDYPVQRNPSGGDEYWSSGPVPDDAEESMAFEVCIDSADCTAEGDGWVSSQDLTLNKESLGETIQQRDCGTDGGDCYAVFGLMGSIRRMRFLDWDSSVQTNPEKPNQFCFRIEPFYEPNQ